MRAGVQHATITGYSKLYVVVLAVQRGAQGSSTLSQRMLLLARRTTVNSPPHPAARVIAGIQVCLDTALVSLSGRCSCVSSMHRVLRILER